jgi:Domain of unknown function (DUF4384)
MRPTVMLFALVFCCGSEAIAEDPVGAKALFQSGEGTAFLAARQKPAPVAKKEQYAGIAYWIDLLRGDDSRVRTTARHEFKSGDRIKLNIKPNRDGYLYVVNTGTTGASRMLYPRAGGDGGNFVRAHHEYAVPDSSYIVFDDNPGIETGFGVAFDPPDAAVDFSLSEHRPQRDAQTRGLRPDQRRQGSAPGG